MRALQAVRAWWGDHPWVVAVVFLGLAITSVAGILDHQQGIDRAQDKRERAEDIQEAIDLAGHDARIDCEAGNESRELFRTIGVRLSTVAVEASNEALIIVVNQVDADGVSPETADLLRQVGVSQAELRAGTAVADLKDRDCETEERTARATAEEAFNGE